MSFASFAAGEFHALLEAVRERVERFFISRLGLIGSCNDGFGG